MNCISREKVGKKFNLKNIFGGLAHESPDFNPAKMRCKQYGEMS